MASVLQAGGPGQLLALARADGAEDVGRGRALIVAAPRAAFPAGPTARDLVLLADARLVREPDLYPVCSDALLPRAISSRCAGKLLKSSTAPSA